METVDVVIIGAGASGLMCAITAATRGRKVLLLEGSNKVGKKILMSGGGRCNFTNLYIEPENFISDNPHFIKSALASYTQWDFISLVNEHNIAYEERKHGQLFCVNSSKDILTMLLNECEKFGVDIQTHCQVSDIKKLGDEESFSYQLKSDHNIYQCESLVVASGALSIPTLGATGFAYDVAQQFNLNVLPRRAGLVPFMFTDFFKPLAEKLSGLSVDVEISTVKSNFKESILFTHRGLSGPAVLQLSSYWKAGESVFINLFPEIALENYLLESKNQKKSLLRNLLIKFLPKALVVELESLFWDEYKEKPLAEYPDKVLINIAKTLHAWELKPSGTEGYRTAEVTLGGIDTKQLSSKTMETKEYKGLFFIGEAVDVTGHLGGFNFQWAWSSAYAAGRVV